jgi:hypothetical protein
MVDMYWIVMNRVTLDLSHATHLHGLLCAGMMLRPAAIKVSAQLAQLA